MLVSSVPLSDTMLSGLPRGRNDPIQFARHPDTGQRRVGDQVQAFTVEVVDYGQNPEAAAGERRYRA